MNTRIKINADELEDFVERFEEVEGRHELTSDDLMTDEFVRGNSQFLTWQEFMNVGGIEKSEDLESQAFSEFIKQNTNFEDFDDMLQSAVAEYVKNLL